MVIYYPFTQKVSNSVIYHIFCSNTNYKNMKDTVLLNVKLLAEAYIRQIDKDNTLIVCSNLLQFSYEKGLLLRSPFDEQGNLKIETIIRESDLTEIGKQIFDDLVDKWLTYTDRTQKYNNIAMLEKYFNKLNDNL